MELLMWNYRTRTVKWNGSHPNSGNKHFTGRKSNGKKTQSIYSSPAYGAEIYMDLYQLHLKHKHNTVPNPEISYSKELHIGGKTKQNKNIS